VSSARSEDELARSWDEAAAGYDEYFVPRFAPWTDVAIAAVVRRAAELPAGPIVVPCCGPGQELEPLARGTGRETIGIDLSPVMVERARARAAGLAGIRAEIGDVGVLAGRFPEGVAAVVSCFGLQQLPAPDRAVEDWTRTLLPGGLLAVMFWPQGPDDDGPSILIRRLLARRLSPAHASWQDRLALAVRGSGGELLKDRPVEFVMTHESAEALWEAMTRWGPMRVLALRQGQASLDAMKPEFLAELGVGAIEQRAAARFLVARKAAGR